MQKILASHLKKKSASRLRNPKFHLPCPHPDPNACSPPLMRMPTLNLLSTSSLFAARSPSPYLAATHSPYPWTGGNCGCPRPCSLASGSKQPPFLPVVWRWPRAGGGHGRRGTRAVVVPTSPPPWLPPHFPFLPAQPTATATIGEVRLLDPFLWYLALRWFRLVGSIASGLGQFTHLICFVQIQFPQLLENRYDRRIDYVWCFSLHVNAKSLFSGTIAWPS